MKDVATAFPLSRTLDIKNGDKTTVTKLFATSDNSYATTDLSSGQVRLDPKKDKKGPLTLAAAGTYNGTTPGRFVVVGSSLWCGNSFIRFNGNRDLFLNMINWLTADEDLISIRPKAPEDRPLNISGAEAEPGVLAERGDLPAGGGGLRPGHLVETEISHEADGTAGRRRRPGGSGRRGLVVE